MKPLSLRQTVMGIAVVAVFSALVGGILMLGSPAEERTRRLDELRVEDLVALARATDLFWTRYSRLPASLEELTSEPGAPVNTNDPGTGVPYEYMRHQGATYELCARFGRSSTLQNQGPDSDFWAHAEGRQCFRREARIVR